MARWRRAEAESLPPDAIGWKPPCRPVRYRHQLRRASMGERFRYTDGAFGMGKRRSTIRHMGTDNLVGGSKPRKYRNIKTRDGSILFDSKREAERYRELKLLEAAKEISSLRLQPKWQLMCSGRAVKIRSKGFPNGRKATYTADFTYWDSD